MSDEKVVEGEGKATFNTGSFLARISRIKLEKYNDKGELVETVIVDDETDG